MSKPFCFMSQEYVETQWARGEGTLRFNVPSIKRITPIVFIQSATNCCVLIIKISTLSFLQDRLPCYILHDAKISHQENVRTSKAHRTHTISKSVMTSTYYRPMIILKAHNSGNKRIKFQIVFEVFGNEVVLHLRGIVKKCIKRTLGLQA